MRDIFINNCILKQNSPKKLIGYFWDFQMWVCPIWGAPFHPLVQHPLSYWVCHDLMAIWCMPSIPLRTWPSLPVHPKAHRVFLSLNQTQSRWPKQIMIHAVHAPPISTPLGKKKGGRTWNQTETSETSTRIDYNVDHGTTKLVMLSKHQMFCVNRHILNWTSYKVKKIEPANSIPKIFVSVIFFGWSTLPRPTLDHLGPIFSNQSALTWTKSQVTLQHTL